MKRLIASLCLWFCNSALACNNALPEQQLHAIGQQIYKNECNKKRQCLVDWNRGEAFPSLGIGHFIWYPADVDEGFVESFPQLIRFLQANNVAIPQWLEQHQPFHAPWRTRTDFMRVKNGDIAESLRVFLEHSMAEQTAFMQQRMQRSIQNIVQQAPANQRHSLNDKINALCSSPAGVYALIDYVNFKGEGLAHSERYNGQGWGLLQVLLAMENQPDSVLAFATAADWVLTRRANNARNTIEKETWLPGWRKRLTTYTTF